MSEIKSRLTHKGEQWYAAGAREALGSTGGQMLADVLCGGR